MSMKHLDGQHQHRADPERTHTAPSSGFVYAACGVIVEVEVCRCGATRRSYHDGDRADYQPWRTDDVPE